MYAIASHARSNNRSSSGSSNYYGVKDKTPEEKAAEEEAYQKKYAEQSRLFNQCQEKAALNPPEYPVQVTSNNNYFSTILRNNEDFVFASSFNDAVKKVQEDIGSMSSNLMDQFKNTHYYKNGDVLRLSSANKSIFRNVSLTLPSGRYEGFMYSVSKTRIPCWNVYISSAAPTMLSSMRIASQNRSNTGGKSRAKKSTRRKSTFQKSTFRKGRAKKYRKSTFKKGRAKKSRKSRRKKGRFFKG
jgi:hypothetical protein